MKNKNLYLIDATAFCYRAFYAIKGFTTLSGQPTNAVFGFVNMLNKLLKEQDPQYLAVCFDVSRKTLRQEKFAEYKAQRPPMPDDLVSQISIIKEVIAAYGIPLYEMAGFEADDVIATLSNKAVKHDFIVTIVSSDKDMLQLVDKNVRVFCPHKDGDLLYDTGLVLERFGVEPGSIPDLIALKGDVSDNIPKIKDIGDKTAVELIKKYANIAKLLKNCDEIKQEKVRNAIKENIGQIELNRELAGLSNSLDIEFDIEKLKVSQPDYKELFRLFKQLEFKKFLADLPGQEEEVLQSRELVRIDDTQISAIPFEKEPLILSGASISDLIYSSGNMLFRVNNPGNNIKQVLADKNIKKSGHDLKNLKISLSNEGFDLNGLYFDTMIAAYLLNPSRSDYLLSELAWDYQNKRLALDLDAGQCVGLIAELLPKLENDLREKSLWKLFESTEMPLVSVLAQMQINGIKLDTELLHELSKELERRLIKLIESIYEISGAQFNINSPKQLREILFERLKLPVIKRSKTGPSTDEEVLRQLSSRHKLPAMLLEYRQLMKLKTTYVDALPALIDAKTGKIHASFNQTGTETGRLSSSNPNLQNIPVRTDIGAKIRQAIIAASSDNCLLACDYSQVELRILAHLSGDENLIKAFKEGKDIHKATASLIYNIKESEVTDQMREMAKRVNFGIVYGLTAYGLSRDLNIPNEESQVFIDAYFTRYSGVKSFIEKEVARARKDGFITTILGRRRYIPEINNKNQGIRQFAERQAVNTPIQGSASDLIKLAMVKIHDDINERKLPAAMIMQIHDELVFDLPKEKAGEFVDLVRDRMENVLKLDVPIKVSISQGQNWLEMEEVK
ncbi:MAG: DNA polymerase I [Candidatus Omnitrophica bacterium]|nr:DNA polymerase I [Candidatus Omnitrophota bacterium]